MAITLGTNIPSYNARTSLNDVSSKLARTMEKLSSGLKINRAGDDAAGLVISKNMEALIRGSKQAQFNIQNASSFLTTAEDGMVSIGDHLQRINDLLVNMANDTNDINSRKAAVDEIIERINEINRLADSTNFNGKTMLGKKEDNEKIIIQMGPDDTPTSVLDISPALTDCHTYEKGLDVDLPLNLNPHAKYAVDADGNRAVVDNTPVLTYVPKEFVEDDGSKKIYYIPDGDKDTARAIGEAAYNALGGTEFDPTNLNCRKYMKDIQAAISTLSTNRGLLGAYENRMDSAYDAMSIRIASLETAKSYYTDTDIAEEATNMSAQQIMQQYNVAILANANTLPQLALSLIG